MHISISKIKTLMGIMANMRGAQCVVEHSHMVKSILYGNCMGKANCMGKIMAIFFHEFEAKRRRPYKAHTKFKMFANFEALYLRFSLVLHDDKGTKLKLNSRPITTARRESDM